MPTGLGFIVLVCLFCRLVCVHRYGDKRIRADSGHWFSFSTSWVLKDQTQIIRLGSKLLCVLSHFADPPPPHFYVPNSKLWDCRLCCLPWLPEEKKALETTAVHSFSANFVSWLPILSPSLVFCVPACPPPPVSAFGLPLPPLNWPLWGRIALCASVWPV